MRRVIFGTLTALLLLARAFGPEEALTARPAGEAALEGALELTAAARDLRELGLGGGLGLRYDGELAAELALRLDLDPARRVRAELALAAARARLRGAEREAVRRALLAHAELWQRQSEQSLAEARLLVRELELEAARTRGASPLELAERELALEEAGLALAAAQAALERAEARARLLGFSPPAEPRVLRFALPPPRSPVRERLEVRLKELEAQAAWRRLATLRAELARGGTPGYRLAAESAGPSLTLAVGPEDPLLAPGEVRFSLAAELSLDPALWLEARAGELEAAALARAQAEGERTRPLALAELRQGAELAWKALRLSQRRAELGGQRAELSERRAAAGLLSPLEAERARLAALEAERAVAEAWRRYLEAVARYLEAADALWEVEK